MTDDYKVLLAEVLKRGNLTLSDEEDRVLSSAPKDDLSVQQLLGAHAFNTGDYLRAVAQTRLVLKAAPTPENTSNLISALTRANQFDEALTVASDPDIPLKDVTRASYLSELHGRLGHIEENKTWSLRALKLKDREARHIVNRPAVVTRSFNIETPERNIISYSLWGTNPRYIEGAIRNCIVARHLYPGWTPRFYIDASVPKAAQKHLRANGAQLRSVPSLPAGRFGLFWRFLVEDDKDVDVYVVRDADSVPSIRERVAVNDWLASNQPFHVMRDFVSHSELVLAGMWGAHRGNVRNMGDKILKFTKSREKVLNSRVDDQLFLRQEIWPWMRGRAFVQDSWFGFGATAPFDPNYPLPGRMHIGQDDHANRDAQGLLRAASAAGIEMREGGQSAK